MNKIRWRVLGTAKIAREKVTPAMQAGICCSIDAIASRKREKGTGNSNCCHCKNLI